jgi:GON domain-containing protein
MKRLATLTTGAAWTRILVLGFAISIPPLVLTAPAAWGALPTRCLDIQIASPGAPDGTYLIFPSGQPFQVYCKGMATSSPAEYLTLAQTGAGQNYSQYTAGGYSPGTSVVTSYTKVRLDPATLLVNIADQTFSSSTGSLYHTGVIPVTSMPYGTAMSCDWTASGVANIDLRGTPFKVIDPFEVGGYGQSGTTNKTNSDQVVSLTGGGACGWNTSQSPGGTVNPFNATGTFQLNLAVVGQLYFSTGFHPPVSMPPAINGGKAGQTYSIKWPLTDSAGNYVTDISVVQSVSYTSVNCDAGTVGDTLTAGSSGGSGLRYDYTDNQFVYNWATPNTPGCYVLEVALTSGQVFPAIFKLR